MSLQSPKPPPPNTVRKITEELAQLVQWMAELIRSRNWFTLLLLVDVSLILFFTPGGFVAKFFNFSFPEWYKVAFWLTVSILFLAALTIAVVTKPSSSKAKTAKFNNLTTIKGLQPFTFEDRELFARLQRQKILRECLNAFINPSFRFGIIQGESGCGKTSFLQAGLCPILNESETNHHGIYIRFSEQEPLITIRKTFCQTLPLQESELASLDLLGLFNLAAEVVFPDALVLFFDQFEQFLVHYRREEDRQPFINALNAWYVSELPVKIVISIREDLTGRLVEFQKALGYSLGPQDIHYLKKFTPNEASQILKVIAEGENISFEENFLEELAERELASREDSLISPVDLQILAWMVEGQKTQELRAFNRGAFQKLGGIEGLLQRFLERTLEARIVPAQRQAAVKVLLALTDLDRQVRAGAFTIAQLQNKFQASLSRAEVEEATCWLARGDVRLLTPFQEEETTRYELAHERLIPVLMRLAGKELSEVDKANQLLERRVNEWLGNNRNSHFLLGIRDLWLIQRQKPYLIWGRKRQHKERLIAASWQRINRVTTVLTTAALVASFFSGWLLCIPQGQIQQVRWQIHNPLGSPLERISDKVAASAAIAIAKDRRWQFAFNLLDNYINRAEDKAYFIGEFAKIVPLQKSSNQAEIKLKKALTETNQIKNSYYQSLALSEIAQVYSQLKDEAAAQEVLKSALIVAQQIHSPSDQSLALREIARVYGQLKDEAIAQEGLKSTLKITEQINDSSDKSLVLREITRVYGQLKDEAIAQEGLKSTLKITEEINYSSDKSLALRKIARVYGQLKDEAIAQEGLKSTLKIIEQIESLREQSLALREIARVYSQLKDEAAAQEVLKSALKVTEEINDSIDKSLALRKIARVYGQLKDEAAAQEVLKLALKVTEEIYSSYDKSLALIEIAQVYGQLKDEVAAHEVLKSALKTAEEPLGFFDENIPLGKIAQVYGQLKDETIVQEGLKLALKATIENSSLFEQSLALGEIAQVYGQLKNEAIAQEGLKSTLKITEQINYSSDKSLALIGIAQVYGQLKDEAAAQKVLKLALKVTEEINILKVQFPVLIGIAQVYGQLKDEAAAQEVLKLALKVTEEIKDSDDQFLALREVSRVYGQLKDKAAAQEILKSALKVTEEIDDSESQSLVLREIAEVSAQETNLEVAQAILHDVLLTAETVNDSSILEKIAVQYAQQSAWGKALRALKNCPESLKVSALAQILTLWAEKNNPKLMNGAVVEELNVKGTPQNYTFDVTIYSPDRDCDYYADWWEVLDEEGNLLYRKVFQKQHVDKQPFKSIGEYINIKSDQVVIVRAHMHTNSSNDTGYEAKQVWIGSVDKGFEFIRLSENFAKNVAKEDPQPPTCQASVQ